MPLSAKQMEYLALAWQCFDQDPKIDYEKFRQIANLASAASARETLRVTKKKLREEYGALSDSILSGTPEGNSSSSAAAKKMEMKMEKEMETKMMKVQSPGSRKRGRANRGLLESSGSTARGGERDDGNDEDDDDDDEELTPMPKRVQILGSGKKEKKRDREAGADGGEWERGG